MKSFSPCHLVTRLPSLPSCSCCAGKWPSLTLLCPYPGLSPVGCVCHYPLALLELFPHLRNSPASAHLTKTSSGLSFLFTSAFGFFSSLISKSSISQIGKLEQHINENFIKVFCVSQTLCLLCFLWWVVPQGQSPVESSPLV